MSPKSSNTLPTLPAAGDRPYWADRLDAMVAQVRARCDDRDWSWTEGGCFAFAEALCKAYKGELWGFCAHDQDADDYPVHHAVVKVGDQFYDYTGMVDVGKCSDEIAVEVGEAIELRSKNDEQVFWFTDDFLSHSEIKKLTAVIEGK